MVLVVEVPAGVEVEWCAAPGDLVRLGRPLLRLHPAAAAAAVPPVRAVPPPGDSV